MPHAVSLNHFFRVVDSETYAAIADSAFLRDRFAVSEQRTTVRADETYTGLYFYAANTYFEIFDVASRRGSRVGDSSIAFGSDASGAVAHHAAALDWVEPQVISREFAGEQVPWFHIGNPVVLEASCGTSIWMMEYVAGFLARWHPEFGVTDAIDRASVLARYAAVLGQSSGDRVVGDVTAIELAVGDERYAELVRFAAGFGWRVRARADVAELVGPGIALRVARAVGSARGIGAVDFALRDPDADERLVLGASTLEMTRGRARWEFGPAAG